REGLPDYFDYSYSAATRHNYCTFGYAKVFHRQKQTKIIKPSLGSDLRLVASSNVDDLAKSDKMIVAGDCPEDVSLAFRRFLHIVEPHPDFGSPAMLVRLDNNVRVGAFHRSTEIHSQLCFATTLERRDAEHRHRVGG